MTTLYYIHDPMCSWCWGFRPVWLQIQEHLPDSIKVEYVLGGLAPDSNEPMPEEMQNYIKMNWKRIQQVIPGTEFNYDFWVNNQAKRSTYPACRAVIAAKNQGAKYESQMIFAIQTAYYTQALNPSNDGVLIDLADNIGLDKKQFIEELNSENTQAKLVENITQYHQLSYSSGAQGFPSLVLKNNEQIVEVPRDYNSPNAALDFIVRQLDL